MTLKIIKFVNAMRNSGRLSDIVAVSVVCECVDICVRACVRVCVYVHPLWMLHLSGTAGTAREQINDVVLKMLDCSAGSRDLYFGMQNLIFQLAALSCS